MSRISGDSPRLSKDGSLVMDAQWFSGEKDRREAVFCKKVRRAIRNIVNLSLDWNIN